MGLFIVLLYTDSRWAYLEIRNPSLHTTYNSRYCIGLSQKISVRRIAYGIIPSDANSVEPRSDVLLLLVRDSIYGDCLFC